jgi:hypothetical protein
MVMAAIIGAVIVFAWGFLAWTVLPFHETTMHAVPDDDAIVTALEGYLPESGVYYYPPMPEEAEGLPEDQQKPIIDAWTARQEAGPVGMIFYRAEGVTPMDPIVMARGFGIDFVAALLVAGMLAAGVRGYVRRLGVVIVAGAFASLTSYMALWNWMHVDTHYAVMMSFDLVIGWALAGVVMAAMVRPSPSS